MRNELTRIIPFLLLYAQPKHVVNRVLRNNNGEANGEELSVEQCDVCVLFCDLVGFTQLGASMSPPRLMNILDKIYSRFDTIVEKTKLYKMDTIGDACKRKL
jgi:class 3 adenylate cyclase